MIFSKMDAIRSLVGNDVSQPLVGDVIYHKDQKPPTESEIDAEIKKLEAEYDAQEYARKRQAEYPTIGDQLDEIYHNGVDSWKAVIKQTKDKYPKG